MLTRTMALGFVALLSACASATSVQFASNSKSEFDGAVFTGEAVELARPTPGEEKDSACASFLFLNWTLSSFETPSTISPTSRPKRATISSFAVGVSSITSWGSIAPAEGVDKSGCDGLRPPKACCATQPHSEISHGLCA
jgi:hypothetical protein